MYCPFIDVATDDLIYTPTGEFYTIFSRSSQHYGWSFSNLLEAWSIVNITLFTLFPLLMKCVFILLVELLWYFFRVIPDHIFLSSLVFLIDLFTWRIWIQFCLVTCISNTSSLIISFNNLFLWHCWRSLT